MSFDELWKQLEEHGDWEPPPAKKQLDAAVRKLPEMPAMLRELYARADGGSAGQVDVFDLDELEDVNLKQKYRKTFPGAVFFASDGGDQFFFVDTAGTLGRGAGAVILMPRASASAGNCVLAAHDLEAFLMHLIRGERPWLQRRTLAASEVRDMLELATASASKYTGKPYDVMGDALLHAADRCGVQIPSALFRLLRAVDGMYIPAPGVTVWPASRLEPVPGISDGTYPGLLWFADDAAGNRYAIAPGGWRDLAPETVVRVAPGAEPATAPAIGRLPQVVTEWLRK